ncbi:synaptogyrin 2 [Homo sapiens]|uniref:Isoform 2 of Synaptogyrin-2 n=1 Tax=Homo sapiens TaxID=9606 RepID=O43760-2|nr:synaptogyrin-2 isoform 3 [Homo sapiens]AAI05993.1 SYNGR2 protein [Homo sapiens]KAI2585347.1 synaptogyrin 2 [Homo sapiens]KAI4051869.1 synaptogyrin 2 [Homo sapiens]|eukprot:XP_005257849.1 synaptogyrin-2 isoform X1 [Homo sapiens]
MESGAYGAAKAGGSFDLRRFLTQPQVVARAVCLVFALIVFSCIYGEGYSNAHESKQMYCVFNRNEDACRYGSAIGVLAFLASAFFLVVDAYFPQISNATDRKYLVIGDLLFSALWTFLWFVGFCFLTNQWAVTNPKDVLVGADSVRAAITFSFFSIFSWVGWPGAGSWVKGGGGWGPPPTCTLLCSPCRVCWPPWPTSATRLAWTTSSRITLTPLRTPTLPTPPTQVHLWTTTNSHPSPRTRRPPRATSRPLCTERRLAWEGGQRGPSPLPWTFP